MREVHLWLGKEESSLRRSCCSLHLICTTQPEAEPPTLWVLFLLVAADLEEELGSLGGHEVWVAYG